MIPEMVEQGYSRGYATGLVAASSMLALLIPPSIPMIVFAMTARNLHSRCFPEHPATRRSHDDGLLHHQPDNEPTHEILEGRPQNVASPKPSGRSAGPPGMRGSRAFYAGPGPWRDLRRCFYTTEAAGMSAVYAVLVGFFVYKKMTLKGLGNNIKSSHGAHPGSIV